MVVDSPEAMTALGARLARACPAPCVIHVTGPLGVGKTTLIRGLLGGLGHAGRVPSPSYSLVEPYRVAGRDVVHVDLYRLTAPGELDELGLEDLLGPATILLVEWPERGGPRLPAPDLTLHLAYAGAGRTLRPEPGTPAGQALANALHRP